MQKKKNINKITPNQTKKLLSTLQYQNIDFSETSQNNIQDKTLPWKMNFNKLGENQGVLPGPLFGFWARTRYLDARSIGRKCPISTQFCKGKPQQSIYSSLVLNTQKKEESVFPLKKNFLLRPTSRAQEMSAPPKQSGGRTGRWRGRGKRTRASRRCWRSSGTSVVW